MRRRSEESKLDCCIAANNGVRKRRPGRVRRETAPREAKTSQVQMLFWALPSAVAFLIYLRVLGFDFIFDDHTLIASNPHVQSWSFLWELFSSHLWSFWTTDTTIPQYRPLFSVWLLLIYTLTGLRPWLWHLSSILLHVLATYSVYRVAMRLLKNPLAAGAAAMLFAIHPIHIEAVSWICSCNELLYTNLVLGSLLFFCRALPNSNPGSIFSWDLWGCASIVLWTAAIFTKESALPVVTVFFLLAFREGAPLLSQKERSLVALRRGAPYVMAIVFYFVARTLAIGRVVGVDKGGHTWAQVIYSSPSLFMFYAGKLVLPTKLSGFYVNPLFSAPSLRIWSTTALIGFGLVGFCWLATKNTAAGLASILLFLPILPVLVGVRVFLDGDLAHDRYMYLPSVGLCLFAGLALKSILARPNPLKIVAAMAGALVAVLFVWLNVTQQKFYKNDDAYFGRGAYLDPGNPLATDYLADLYLYRGRAQQDKGMIQKALKEFNRAYTLAPKDVNVRFCLARGQYAAGDLPNAEPELELLAASKDLRPYRREVVLLTFAQTEIRLKHLARAEDILKQLESENDGHWGLHDTFGALYQMEGRIPEAQVEFTREYQITGNPRSKEKSLYLAQLMNRASGANARSRVQSPEMGAVLQTPTQELEGLSF